MKKTLIIIICFFITGCHNGLAKKNLSNGFANYEMSSLNNSVYSITVKEDYIQITSSEYEYQMKYELGEKLTFVVEEIIEKGNTYDEYILKTKIVSLPIIAFIAIANSHDISVEAAYLYYSQICLDGISQTPNLSDQFIISDSNPDNDKNIILMSEFGDRVIEYTKSMYVNNLNIKDEKNNLFEYNLINDCGIDKCKIKVELAINSLGNFENI